MIFVDSNLFVIDLRYRDDPNYRVNRRALDRLAEGGQGMTSVLNLLEVCGILSFNLFASALHGPYLHVARRYVSPWFPPQPTTRDCRPPQPARCSHEWSSAWCSKTPKLPSSLSSMLPRLMPLSPGMRNTSRESCRPRVHATRRNRRQRLLCCALGHPCGHTGALFICLICAKRVYVASSG